MKEEIGSSFKNAPPYHKFFFLVFSLGIPILCFSYIGWYYSTADHPTFDGIIFPLVFGIVTPAVMVKDIFGKEVITITDRKVSWKKLSGHTEIPYTQIKRVFFLHIKNRYWLDSGNRDILFIYGKKTKDLISCANLFSDEDRNYLLEILQHYEAHYVYEIVYTENTSEVFSYLTNPEIGTQFQPAQSSVESSRLPPHKKQKVSGTSSRIRRCQSCHQPLSYIKEHDRWFCYACGEYDPE